jgi:hypothetical protein
LDFGIDGFTVSHGDGAIYGSIFVAEILAAACQKNGNGALL